MSHYEYPHPWNPGFAIPKYVLSEPQGRGAFITKQLPRGTIGEVPFDRQVWNRTKWAVPNYAQGRYDRSAMTTKQLPRRTVGLLAPDFFSRPGPGYALPDPGRIDQRAHVVSTSLIGPKPGAVAVGSTLDGTTIGGASTLGALATPAKGDPIVEYGRRGAAMILREVMKRPRAQRAAEMQGALDSISPDFRGDVEEKAKKYREQGIAPKEALRRGLSAALSNKLLDDFIKAGTGQPGTLFSELGGVFGWVKDKLGDVHCAVATSGITKTAATVAGGVYGGPAGAAAAGAGAQLLAQPCGGGGAAAGGAAPLPGGSRVPASTVGSPLIPLAIAAGGALALFLVLK